MEMIWNVELEDGMHTITVNLNRGTGRFTVYFDGAIIYTRILWVWREKLHEFQHNNHIFVITHIPNIFRVKLALMVDGRIVDNEPGILQIGNPSHQKATTAVPEQINTTTERLQLRQLVGVSETYRSEEHIGADERIIDNSRSGGKQTRRFSISKEWIQSYNIEYEKAQTNRGEFVAGLSHLISLNFKMQAEEAIKSKYYNAEETRRTYTEDIQIEVLPYTKMRMQFNWKRIWQHGLLRFRDTVDREIEVPFQVSVELTFDQTQVDEA